MAISDILGAIRNSLPALRDAAHTYAAAKRRIDEIDAEVERIDRLPPHRDDIVDLYTRHMDEAAFVEDFRNFHLNETTLSAMSGTTLANHGGAHVLTVGYGSPSYRSLVPCAARDETGGYAVNPLPSTRALLFFLGPLLRQRIPELVDKALPPGYKGITSAERAAKIDKLTKERKKLLDECAELESALKLTHTVATARAGTHGSDEDNRTARERAEALVIGRLDSITNMSIDQAIDQAEAAIVEGEQQ
jgi:hypothetical protein